MLVDEGEGDGLDEAPQTADQHLEDVRRDAGPPMGVSFSRHAADGGGGGDLIADGNPPEIDEVDRYPKTVLANERGQEIPAQLTTDLRYTVTLEQPNHCPE